MTKNIIKMTLGLFLICSLSLNMSSCNYPITDTSETEVNASDTESETTPSEADLERGREEIMEQRAIQESFSSEENSDEFSSEELSDEFSSEENSSESSTSDNYQTQERRKKRITNWNCSYCCKIVQKSEEPDGGRCRGSYKHTTYAGKSHTENGNADHYWHELSTVGNRKFECSHCQVVIDSEDEPRHGTCDGGDRLDWHYWREL